MTEDKKERSKPVESWFITEMAEIDKLSTTILHNEQEHQGWENTLFSDLLLLAFLSGEKENKQAKIATALASVEKTRRDYENRIKIKTQRELLERLNTLLPVIDEAAKVDKKKILRNHFSKNGFELLAEKIKNTETVNETELSLAKNLDEQLKKAQRGKKEEELAEWFRQNPKYYQFLIRIITENISDKDKKKKAEEMLRKQYQDMLSKFEIVYLTEEKKKLKENDPAEIHLLQNINRYAEHLGEEMQEKGSFRDRSLHSQLLKLGKRSGAVVGQEKELLTRIITSTRDDWEKMLNLQQLQAIPKITKESSLQDVVRAIAIVKATIERYREYLQKIFIIGKKPYLDSKLTKALMEQDKLRQLVFYQRELDYLGPGRYKDVHGAVKIGLLGAVLSAYQENDWSHFLAFTRNLGKEADGLKKIGDEPNSVKLKKCSGLKQNLKGWEDKLKGELLGSLLDTENLKKFLEECKTILISVLEQRFKEFDKEEADVKNSVEKVLEARIKTLEKRTKNAIDNLLKILDRKIKELENPALEIFKLADIQKKAFLTSRVFFGKSWRGIREEQLGYLQKHNERFLNGMELINDPVRNLTNRLEHTKDMIGKIEGDLDDAKKKSSGINSMLDYMNQIMTGNYQFKTDSSISNFMMKAGSTLMQYAGATVGSMQRADLHNMKASKAMRDEDAQKMRAKVIDTLIAIQEEQAHILGRLKKIGFPVMIHRNEDEQAKNAGSAQVIQMPNQKPATAAEMSKEDKQYAQVPKAA